MEQRKRNFALYETGQWMTITKQVVIPFHHIAHDNFTVSLSSFPIRQDILFIFNLKMKNQLPKGKSLAKFTQQLGDRTGARTVVLSAPYNVASCML